MADGFFARLGRMFDNGIKKSAESIDHTLKFAELDAAIATREAKVETSMARVLNHSAAAAKVDAAREMEEIRQRSGALPAVHHHAVTPGLQIAGGDSVQHAGRPGATPSVTPAIKLREV